MCGYIVITRYLLTGAAVLYVLRGIFPKALPHDDHTSYPQANSPLHNHGHLTPSVFHLPPLSTGNSTVSFPRLSLDPSQSYYYCVGDFRGDYPNDHYYDHHLCPDLLPLAMIWRLKQSARWPIVISRYHARSSSRSYVP